MDVVGEVGGGAEGEIGEGVVWRGWWSCERVRGVALNRDCTL